VRIALCCWEDSFVSRFRSYDGTELFYSIYGSGPPLVCLAGGPGADVRCLGDLAGLDRHRTLILLDARAAGRSETPTDPTTCAYTEQTHDIEALCRHLDIERADLLAHSAGTLTAQEFAVRHPERLGMMVLVTPAGRTTREVDEDEVAEIRARRAGDPEDAKARAAGAKPAEYGTWSEEARRHHAADHPLPPPWLRGSFYGAMTPADPARQASVANPVLVLVGADDGVAGTAPGRLVATSYPDARLSVLPGCGHWPWIDAPSEFRDVVVGFLNGHALRRPGR
jgi:pimeloyl-ACP methyl ester carboxylesterase